MKKLFFVMLGTICLASNLCPATPVQWDENGHLYEIIIVTGGINWTNALNDAHEKGGYLATITSQQENDFVFNLTTVSGVWFSSNEWMIGPWLGGTDSQGSWQWVTGEPWEYTSWLSGQPDNWNGNENYLLYWGRGAITSTWNDSADGASSQGYVLEYVPEPTTIALLCLGGLLLRRKK